MMLRNLKNLSLSWSQYVGHSDPRHCIAACSKLLNSNQRFDLRYFNIYSPYMSKFQNGHNEKNVEIDKTSSKGIGYPGGRKQHMFPDIHLPEKLFDGVMFKELPVVNIKVTRNNTIMNLTDSKGVPKLLRSCGVEGFKNTKKGTNVAAQATGLTFGRRAVTMGYKTVRVRIQGMGPGRVGSVRGLVIGGLNIVSITDNSHVSDNYPRPKKLRRI